METKELIIGALSQGKLSIKDTEDTWYNFDTMMEEKLRKVIHLVFPKLQKGQKIRLKGDLTKKTYQVIEILEEPKKSWVDEMTSLAELLTDAHKKGLIEIRTEMITVDWEKKSALFKAIVKGPINKEKEIGEFSGYGDATQENITSDKIKQHWIRMAESRSIARALRWYVGKPEVAKEELESVES